MLNFPALAPLALIFESTVVLVAEVLVETFSMALNDTFTSVTSACLNSRLTDNLFPIVRHLLQITTKNIYNEKVSNTCNNEQMDDQMHEETAPQTFQLRLSVLSTLNWMMSLWS
jgi:hypothetical protein